MTDEGFSITHVSEVGALPAPWSDGIEWRPLRHHFGLGAFGLNAYTAERADVELVEDHDETGGAAGGHQEIYVVLSGRVRFRVAGQETEAGPGTVLAVTDPTVRRGGEALEPGTTVLAVGGPTGAAFVVSPWEYSFRAYGVSKGGDHESAVGTIQDGLTLHPEHPRLLYDLACFEALAGRADEALGHLRRAVELDPRTVEWAAEDPDLDAIRDRPGFPGAGAAPGS